MDIREYTKDIEDVFIQFLYSDPETFVRVKNIVSPTFFEDKTNRETVKFLLEYSNENATLPNKEQIFALTHKNIELIADADKHVDWFLKKFEKFCQQKAAKEAVYNSLDLINENRLGEVVERIKKAAELGIVKDLGIDYFEEPAKRLEKMRDRSKMVSTGWKAIDNKLYGGLEKGTLTIYAGQSGAGKSLFLQNQALNWSELGLNVVYITLELSQDLTSMRLDAMTSGYATKEIMRHIDEVDFKVKQFQKSHKGSLQVKQLPTGSSANDIRAYIKEYETQTSKKVDAVLVDYLDLCSPIDKRVSPSDLWVKDKYVSEELRAMGVDMDIIVVTASQLNRASHDEIEFAHSHIAGGISKINTADNVIGIFTTISMKEAGRYQVQFMKTRSSAGVGSKVDLKFNTASLRITDLSEEEEDATSATASSLLDSLKKKSVLNEDKDKPTEAKNDKALRDLRGLRDLVKGKNI